MTKQLLYYENVVPVSEQRHRDWSLAPRTSFDFADQSNSVPLAVVEFPMAAQEYPIVFTGTEEVVQPAVILGLKPDENLFLNEEKKWNAKYIPAFVRRYPFVFSKSTKEDNKFILCIDEKYAGWNQEGNGKPLFDDNGERTEYLNNILNFVQDYQVQAMRTQDFCKKLQALDLLEPVSAKFKLPSGKQAAMTGFMAVNRKKLAELPGDKLAELAKTGELEMIYVHLQSLRNLSMLAPRVGEAIQSENEERNASESLH